MNEELGETIEPDAEWTIGVPATGEILVDGEKMAFWLPKDDPAQIDIEPITEAAE